MFKVESCHSCCVCHAVPIEDIKQQQNLSGIEESSIKKVEKLFRCGQCHIPTYCSKECQKEDWKRHKLVCLSNKVNSKQEENFDLNKIYAEIGKESKFWCGHRKIFIDSPVSSLKAPCERKEWWGRVANLMPAVGLISLLATMRDEGEGKVAIDMGCGHSESAIYLLKKGWKVIGVDYSPKALKVLETVASKTNQEWLKTEQLILSCSRIETYQWPAQTDLILACSSLPYFDPQKIRNIMANIYHSLKPGGHFIGNFFATKYIKNESQDVEREMGAWFVKDETMVRHLLIGQGYEVVKCEHGGLQNPKSVIFVGKKMQ